MQKPNWQENVLTMRKTQKAFSEAQNEGPYIYINVFSVIEFQFRQQKLRHDTFLYEPLQAIVCYRDYIPTINMFNSISSKKLLMHRHFN